MSPSSKIHLFSAICISIKLSPVLPTGFLAHSLPGFCVHLSYCLIWNVRRLVVLCLTQKQKACKSLTPNAGQGSFSFCFVGRGEPQLVHWGHCLSPTLLSVARINTMTKINLGSEGFIHYQRKSKQELKEEAWSRNPLKCCLLDCSPWSWIASAHLPGDCNNHSGLGPTVSISN